VGAEYSLRNRFYFIGVANRSTPEFLYDKSHGFMYVEKIMCFADKLINLRRFFKFATAFGILVDTELAILVPWS
jgi:hypothetical protein